MTGFIPKDSLRSVICGGAILASSTVGYSADTRVTVTAGGFNIYGVTAKSSERFVPSSRVKICLTSPDGLSSIELTPEQYESVKETAEILADDELMADLTIAMASEDRKFLTMDELKAEWDL